MPQKRSEDDVHHFMPETRQLMMDQLRKLQHHSRSNVPAEIARKAKNAFSVSMDTEEFVEAQAALKPPISLLVYPQNPFVSDPEMRELSATEVHAGLRNARAIIRDSRHPAAQPDVNGNYLYWYDTPQFNQVNAFYYTIITLRMYEKYAQRQIAWAFTAPRINIDPHAGDGANAFYDENNRTIGFFSFVHSNGMNVNTAHSADVVAHESGHAILDGLRDLYNESFGLGPLAFHESFADMSAVLVALHDDSLVRQLLTWTEGDLRVDNFVAKVAERIIEQVKQAAIDTQEIDERTIYLRNAVNRFTYKPFDDLPYTPENPTLNLGRESHNYSRLFTGAFYDALVNIYEHHKQDVNPHIALVRARDVIGHMVVYAVECGPVGELNFADMARAFLTADHVLYDGHYFNELSKAFAGRDILSTADATTHIEALENLPEVILPPSVDSALEAGMYLYDQVLPALGIDTSLEFTPLSAHRNKLGYAFLTFFSTRSTRLEGTQYLWVNGVEIDVFGGITLAFAPNGRLQSAVYRPVTDEDIRQIKVLAADLINHGVVTEMSFMGGARVLSDEVVPELFPSVLPHFLFMSDQFSEAGKRVSKLVRESVIVDTVPEVPAKFLEYLQSLLRKS